MLVSELYSSISHTHFFFSLKSARWRGHHPAGSVGRECPLGLIQKEIWNTLALGSAGDFVRGVPTSGST